MLKKFLCLALCLSFLLCAVACANEGDPIPTGEPTNAPTNLPTDTPTDPTSDSQNQAPSTPTPESPDVLAAQYESLVFRYTELLTQKINETATVQAAASDLDDAVLTLLDRVVAECRDPQAMGYATKDINSDGVDELVLLDEKCNLYALFSIYDGKLIVVDSLMYYASIDEKGNIYRLYDEMDGDTVIRSVTYQKRLQNGALIGTELCLEAQNGERVYYHVENGVRTDISFEQYDVYCRRYSPDRTDTKMAGFRFVSATKEPDLSIPEVNLSTYDAILDTYRAIITLKWEDSYRNWRTPWTDGEFDRIYRFVNNETYETYTKLFYATWMYRTSAAEFSFLYLEDAKYAYGYAKKDLNGDGVEELILLTETYDVIAIFTLKNGKAVMLDRFDGNRYAWIDEQGLVHVHHMMSADFDRSNESYLFEIVDGTWQTKLAIGYWNDSSFNRQYYRLENGNRVMITEAEWETLDAKIMNVSSSWSHMQYTASRAGLQFVRLFDWTPTTEGLEGKQYQKAGFTTIGDSGALRIQSVTATQIRFEMDYTKFREDSPTVAYEETLSLTATLTDGEYRFQTDDVSGKIEFGVTGAFVVLETANKPVYDCGVYIYLRIYS